MTDAAYWARVLHSLKRRKPVKLKLGYTAGSIERCGS